MPSPTGQREAQSQRRSADARRGVGAPPALDGAVADWRRGPSSLVLTGSHVAETEAMQTLVPLRAPFGDPPYYVSIATTTGR